jgi:hypothetical protein
MEPDVADLAPAGNGYAGRQGGGHRLGGGYPFRSGMATRALPRHNQSMIMNTRTALFWRLAFISRRTIDPGNPRHEKQESVETGLTDHLYRH